MISVEEITGEAIPGTGLMNRVNPLREGSGERFWRSSIKTASSPESSGSEEE